MIGIHLKPAFLDDLGDLRKDAPKLSDVRPARSDKFKNQIIDIFFIGP
jgi:hypothetical protein